MHLICYDQAVTLKYGLCGFQALCLWSKLSYNRKMQCNCRSKPGTCASKASAAHVSPLKALAVGFRAKAKRCGSGSHVAACANNLPTDHPRPSRFPRADSEVDCHLANLPPRLAQVTRFECVDRSDLMNVFDKGQCATASAADYAGLCMNASRDDMTECVRPDETQRSRTYATFHSSALYNDLLYDISFLCTVRFAKICAIFATSPYFEVTILTAISADCALSAFVRGQGINQTPSNLRDVGHSL